MKGVLARRKAILDYSISVAQYKWLKTSSSIQIATCTLLPVELLRLLCALQILDGVVERFSTTDEK